MKKNIIVFLVLVLVASIMSGCQKKEQSPYQKFSGSFFDTFDSSMRVIGYAKSEEEFDSYFNKIHKRFKELHELYDIYNTYEEINNIKTINDNAGIKPVKVNKEIIDLILFAKDWYKNTDGKTNIAMGPVLRVWSQYRDDAEYDPINAKLPPMEDLLEANNYTNIDKIIVDIQKSTVYLEEKRMSLDVGAVAKGYATEIVAKEIMAEGFESGMISAGGNVRVLGKPLDGVRELWGIGIQDPNKFIFSDDTELIDTIFLNNASVVTSGDYQRYYIVDDQIIHHLIDSETLMPGEYFRAVTVITEDSALADFLSTTVFLMPYEEGRKLVDGLDGVEAIWIMKDDTIEATDGMKKIMKSNGASGAKPK
ncbi:MAG: FAD:protein FMN transferase [Tissierellales bacterium]